MFRGGKVTSEHHEGEGGREGGRGIEVKWMGAKFVFRKRK